jgi:hypothetical protein
MSAAQKLFVGASAVAGAATGFLAHDAKEDDLTVFGAGLGGVLACSGAATFAVEAFKRAGVKGLIPSVATAVVANAVLHETAHDYLESLPKYQHALIHETLALVATGVVFGIVYKFAPKQV